MALPIKNGKPGTGYRVHGAVWSYGYHKGIDFPCPVGTDVLAVADGRCIGIGSWGSAFGPESVIIKHGGYYAIYAHLSKALIKVGDVVTVGQHIGESGGRPGGIDGNVTGPHLHFEVLTQPNWSPFMNVDPAKLLNTPGPFIKPTPAKKTTSGPAKKTTPKKK